MSSEYIIVIPSVVKQDIEEIILYYQHDRKEYARQVYNRIISSIHSLKIFPEKGRIVPELEKNNIIGIRELIESYWRIIYRVENQNVILLTVIDGRRNIDDILIRKLKRKFA